MTSRLVGGSELLSGCKTIVDPWVRNVGRKVLQWAFTSDNSLYEEAKHREHGETSVLQFLDLELRESIRVISKTQRIEGTTRVERVKTLRPLETSTVVTVTLNGTHEDDLDDQGSNDGVSVDNTGDAEVLDTFVREDLGTSIEPSDVSSVGGPFGDDAAESTKHGPASVDDLDLAVLGKSLGVSRETSGIPAVVTGVFTLEVGNIRGEGAKELGAVGAVPERGRERAKI